MSTGLVENWLDVDTFGAIYPFVGTEGLLAIVGIACWIGWHIWQIKSESTEFKNDLENIRKLGGPGSVLDEEVDRESKDIVGR